MIKQMTIEEYLSDPCSASSLPLWKTETINVPDSLLIIRDDAFIADQFTEYNDAPYFKVIHRLSGISEQHLNGKFQLVSASVEDYAQHIHTCYGWEITAMDLKAYMSHPVYHPDLWLAVKDMETGQIIASGIAELDARIGEGILEWIQVSPNYRRMGFGKYIVQELLWRMKDRASFVTVSGELNNKSNPLALYLRCGFTHTVIWHILSRRSH